MPIRLSEEEFDELVEQAMESLPEEFLQYMENISVEVRPLPSPRQERRGKNRRTVLLGLYVGVPLTKKSVEAPYEWPEEIFIFQRNIETVCDTREEIVQQVRQTVLHEVGHHFGMSEKDLRRWGYG
jgi:predicted Zn-dependent protease with MMP-like domain